MAHAKNGGMTGLASPLSAMPKVGDENVTDLTDLNPFAVAEVRTLFFCL